MHAPLHSTRGLAHEPPHFVPSHVAVPFVMAAQGMHDDDPHEPTSLLLTHLVPQRW